MQPCFFLSISFYSVLPSRAVCSWAFSIFMTIALDTKLPPFRLLQTYFPISSSSLSHCMALLLEMGKRARAARLPFFRYETDNKKSLGTLRSKFQLWARSVFPSPPKSSSSRGLHSLSPSFMSETRLYLRALSPSRFPLSSLGISNLSAGVIKSNVRVLEGDSSSQRGRRRRRREETREWEIQRLSPTVIRSVPFPRFLGSPFGSRREKLHIYGSLLLLREWAWSIRHRLRGPTRKKTRLFVANSRILWIAFFTSDVSHAV